MKILFDINGLSRLGEELGAVWEILNKYRQLAPLSTFLHQNEDEGNGRDLIIDRNTALAMGREKNGYFEIKTICGAVSLSWHLHAKAWFQGVSGELIVSAGDLPAIKDAVSEMSEMLMSAYSIIDLQEIRAKDIVQFSGKGMPDDPWDCLDDLYWYNYFGPDLTKVLRDIYGLQFEVDGLGRRQLARGWEMYVDDLPKRRPYPPQLETYLKNTNVFRRYDANAKFRSGRIQFDYSLVRRS